MAFSEHLGLTMTFALQHDANTATSEKMTAFAGNI